MDLLTHGLAQRAVSALVVDIHGGLASAFAIMFEGGGHCQGRLFGGDHSVFHHGSCAQSISRSLTSVYSEIVRLRVQHVDVRGVVLPTVSLETRKYTVTCLRTTRSTAALQLSLRASAHDLWNHCHQSLVVLHKNMPTVTQGQIEMHLPVL